MCCFYTDTTYSVHNIICIFYIHWCLSHLAWTPGNRKDELDPLGQRTGLFYLYKSLSKLLCQVVTWWLGGHCKKGRDSKSGSTRYWIHIHPEGDPGYDYYEHGWQVALYQVEANRATQVELCYQTAVVTCKQSFVRKLCPKLCRLFLFCNTYDYIKFSLHWPRDTLYPKSSH
jgi:hypothetical protein